MKDLHRQVLEDTKKLRDAAFENAKNILVEQLSPKIRESVDLALGEAKDEDEEEVEKDEPVEEANDAMQEQDDNMQYEARGESDDVEVDLNDLMDKEEPAGRMEQPEEEPKKEEAFSVTREDLQRTWNELKAEALREVQVSKGFKDQADPNKEEGNAGLSDQKSGESHWVNVEPPAAVDYSVKEVRKYQNALRLATGKIAEQKKVIDYLSSQINEVNLFNHKLAYVTKLTRDPNLAPKVKAKIVEAMDAAKSVREVKLIANSYAMAMKSLPNQKANLVKESRNRLLKSGTASRVTRPSATLLNEGANKAITDRLAVLAGIVEE